MLSCMATTTSSFLFRLRARLMMPSSASANGGATIRIIRPPMQACCIVHGHCGAASRTRCGGSATGLSATAAACARCCSCRLSSSAVACASWRHSARSSVAAHTSHHQCTGSSAADLASRQQVAKWCPEPGGHAGFPRGGLAGGLPHSHARQALPFFLESLPLPSFFKEHVREDEWPEAPWPHGTACQGVRQAALHGKA